MIPTVHMGVSRSAPRSGWKWTYCDPKHDAKNVTIMQAEAGHLSLPLADILVRSPFLILILDIW
jgi:hypothetical protein